MTKPAYRLTEHACPRCLALARDGLIRVETVQRIPEGAWAPRSRDDGKPCCRDCQSADTLVGLGSAPNFLAARIAVGNERQEQYRLPGIPMGLVLVGLARPSSSGDFEDQLRWLEENNWFGTSPSEDA